MKQAFIASFATLLLLSAAVAAERKLVPSGSKLFITPMESGLDGFIAAEIIKKKLPVKVVTAEADADYVLVGTSVKADDKWYHVAFGGKDKNEGSVRLLDVKSKEMIWAGEAGDRSLFFSGIRRGGQRKVADRIVNDMKHNLW
jgi:hypothetical protein